MPSRQDSVSAQFIGMGGASHNKISIHPVLASMQDSLG
jgi:hypothetical protein